MRTLPPFLCQGSVLRVFKAKAIRIRRNWKQTQESALSIELESSSFEDRSLTKGATPASSILPLLPKKQDIWSGQMDKGNCVPQFRRSNNSRLISSSVLLRFLTALSSELPNCPFPDSPRFSESSESPESPEAPDSPASSGNPDSSSSLESEI